MTEETLFAAALEQADPAAYLAAHCPDPAARRRVEELLAAHAAAGSFLNHPAVGADVTTALPPADPGATRTQASTDPDATADPRTGPADPADALAFLKPPTRPGSLGRLAHYEVLEVLGSGGFGTVLKAFDDRLHRAVAVKVLAPQLAASGAARTRFEREARSAAAVRDEHVVNVYAVSEPGDPLPYLVMELVAGQTLQAKIDKAGPLPPREVLRIGSQIARGLAAAPSQGLIDRDIKPANVLLENGVERVKVTDFGLARAADDASLSQSGVVAGTPMYMSPEQARGDTLDTRSDLFSLGSVLYVLCTGRPPFRADSTLAVLKRVVEDEPRPVREVNPEVPRWLADVVAKLHAKNPADRFQTAAEVAELLSGYLAELQQQGTVVSRVAAPPKRVPTDTGWRWWLAACLVFGLLSAAAVLPEYTGPGDLTRRDALEALAYGFGFIAGFGVVATALLSVVSRRWAALTGADAGVGARVAGVCRRWSWRAGAVTAAAALAAAANGGLRLLTPADIGAPPKPAVLTLRLSNTAMQYRVDGQGPHMTGVSVVEVPLEPGEHWVWFQLGDRAYRTSKFRLDPGGRNELVIAASGGFATATLDGTQIGLSGGPVLPPTRPLQAPFDHGTARDGQEAWAMQLGVPVEFTHPSGVAFRLIPPGEYGMGLTAAELAAVRAELKALPNIGDYERFAAESSAPRHTVRITRPFYLAKYETTADQFRRFAEATGHAPTGKLDWKSFVSAGREEKQPVLGVSWDDATAFCRWLGAGYELPTEAQWEYAARAGNPGPWAFGDAPAELVDHAVVGQATPTAGPVGLKKANGFGLYDVHGNADEWCRDWHAADFYRRAPVDDPVNLEPPTQPNTGRASRGGSWNAAAVFSRVAFRTFDHPTRPALPKGFRVALTGDLKAAVDAARRSAAPWGEVVNPAGDCTVSEAGGVLTLRVPAGDHDLNPHLNTRAPRAWQEVAGDFRLRAKVGRTEAAGAGKAAGAPFPFAGAGLVVWRDERNFVRLLRGDTVEAHWFRDGVLGGVPKLPDAAYLEVERTGSRLTLRTSPDGVTWADAAATDVPAAERLWVGAAAVSTLNRDLTFALSDRQLVRAPGDGFTPLFNGRDLTGWKTHPDQPGDWKVEGGELVGRGPAVSYLVTTRGGYENIRLRAEVKINAPGNSGILVRSAPAPADGTTDPAGIECEINPSSAKHPTGSLRVARDANYTSPEPSPPAGEWTTIELRIDGRRVDVEVNGRPVVRGVLPDATPGHDHIALQVHHPQTEVRFRKIEVMDLSPRPAAAPPPAVAPFTAEQAKAHQDAWARHLGVKVAEDGPLGMKLVLVPPGEFLMGSDAAELAALTAKLRQEKREPHWIDLVQAEGPAAAVRLTRPWRVSDREVTNAQFRAFVEATGYKTDAEKARGNAPPPADDDPNWFQDKTRDWRKPGLWQPKDDYPVLNVSWNDAAAFCRWLGEKAGRPCRLPTEAEWEFACRAGSAARYSFGDDPRRESDYVACGRRYPAEVGGRKANAFGLFDLEGNAWEWCGSRYASGHGPGPLTDPTGPAGADLRPVRGGAWLSPWHTCRCASRWGYPPDHRDAGIGFRVAFDLTPAAAPPPAVAPFTPAQAKAHQEAWAKHLGVPVEFTNDLGMTFRLVPPGEFTLGSTAEQAESIRREFTRLGVTQEHVDAVATETPPVRVRLTRPIYLAAREVEVRQFRRFVEATKHKTDAEAGGGGQVVEPPTGRYVTDPKTDWKTPGYSAGDTLPVSQVSWNDARAFCAWLSKADGVTARLPTEAEWEYACRAGGEGTYSFADEFEAGKRVVCETTAPRPTGSRAANGFGLFDLEGNVSEWVGGYARSDRTATPLTDPDVAPAAGLRMFRGGGFPQSHHHCRPAARYVDKADARTLDTGFRVAIVGDLKAAADRAGWRSLFNGRDLTGWKVHPDQPGRWEVRDGVLAGGGKAGYLFSDREYGDFHLRAEVRVNDAGNSGLLFHAEHGFNFDLARIKGVGRAPVGYELELTTPQGVGPAVAGSVARYGPDVDITRSRVRAAWDGMKADTWVKLEVIARGDRRTVRIDDREVLGFDEPNPVRRRGHFALQLFTAATAVEFRKIEVKEPPAPPPGAVVLPAPEAPWVSLFDGKTLAGWKTHPDAPGGWKVEDGALVAATTARSVLFTDRGDFADFRLRVEAKADARAGGVVWVRRPFDIRPVAGGAARGAGGYGATIGPAGTAPSGAAQPTGSLLGRAINPDPQARPKAAEDWFTLEVEARGDRVRVFVDGRPAADYTDPDRTAARGHVALSHTLQNQSRVFYRKIEVQELPPAWPYAAVLQARRDRVAAREKELAAVKARFDAGTVTRREVAEAEIGVYEAKLDGAPGAATVRLLGQLVEKHEVRREVVAARVAAGALAPDAVNPIDADIALAKARLLIARRAEPPLAMAPFPAEQAKAYQEMWARHLGVPPEVSNDLGMSFRVVPAGSFLMGSTPAEVDAVLAASPDLKGAEGFIQDRVRSEAPARKVTITEPFLIGTHEVTVGQFREFVKATGHKTHAEKTGGGAVWDDAARKWGQDPEAVWHNPKYAGSENHPAVFLNPADARAFCKWLGEQDGRTYALPTEEQWEFACRAGTTTRWWFGDDPTGMKDAGWTVEVSFGKHRPVGQKKANPFGLFDPHGGATEMATTPQGEVYERGGQANETAWRARSAWRNPVAEDARPHGRRGFRVVVVGDPAPRAKE